MGRPLHEKIAHLLSARGLLRKDLARALGIAPQTMSDILTGRSELRLRYLPGLVRFFNIRVDYWLDGSKEDPTEEDRHSPAQPEAAHPRERGGVVLSADGRALASKVRMFLDTRLMEWVERFGPLTASERRLLGMPAAERSENGHPPPGAAAAD